MRAVITVPRALDADLLRWQGMSLSEYNALMNLSKAPGQRLRMGDLTAACALSISGMTRIVTRLAEQDLMRRERSPDDGRGQNAVLTDRGLQRNARPGPPTWLACDGTSSTISRGSTCPRWPPPCSASPPACRTPSRTQPDDNRQMTDVQPHPASEAP